MANRFTYFGAAMISAGLAFRTMRWGFRTSHELQDPGDDRANGSSWFSFRRREFLVPGPGVEAPPCPNCNQPLALMREGSKTEPFRCQHCGWGMDVKVQGL